MSKQLACLDELGFLGEDIIVYEVAVRVKGKLKEMISWKDRELKTKLYKRIQQIKT